MNKYILISIIMCAMAASAQPPAPAGVVPGSKGQLPVVPALPDFTEDCRFAALNCFSTLGSDWTTFQRGQIVVNVSWAEPARFGGTSYTLEYRYGTSGEWQTEKDENNAIMYYDKESLGTAFRVYSLGSTIQFRVRMHGGDMDGYLSNEITVKTPSMFCAFGGYGESGNPDYCLVGSPILTEYNITVRAYNKTKQNEYESYTNEDGYFRYKWYRRNPKTYDVTLIEGANTQTYTPTMDDLGYWLYCEISGDEEHCSFIYRYLLCPMNPICSIPVQAAPAYYGEDGFVLNTDYVIPEPENNLLLNWYDWNEETSTGEEKFESLGNKLTVRKPGQYAVKLPMEKYAYNMLLLPEEMRAKGYSLNFAYEHGPYSEEFLWYREVQLMPDRYLGGLTVKTTLGGAPVAANLEIIGPDIDNTLAVKATATTDAETGSVTFSEGLYTLGDGYYLKASIAGGNAVYYPGTASTTGAKLVKPGYDEDWNPVIIDFELNGSSDTTPQGDVNGDSTVDVADIASVISVMAKGGNDKTADVNNDGIVDVADIATIISIMVKN